MDSQVGNTPPEIIFDYETKKSFSRVKLLGKGGFATCYLILEDDTGLHYALKVFDKKSISTFSGINRVKRELEIHSQLDHKNIVKFFGHFEDENFIYLKLEYCDNQTLNNLLARKTFLDENEIRFYMRQAALGLVELHSKHKIIHRDFKPSNLLLTKEMQLKIADFGLSVYSNQINGKQSICGTPNYMSPEVVNAKGAVMESDIWSFGCILYYLFVGRQPFAAENTKKIYEKINSHYYTLPRSIPDAARDLIKTCLHKESVARPSAIQIVLHKFFDYNSFVSTNIIGFNNISINSFNKPFKNRSSYRKLFLDLIDALELNLLSKNVCKIKNCIETNKADIFWVTKWVDFTNQHGFGVVLSNGSTCIIFNDKSTLLLDKTQKLINFICSSKSRIYSTNDVLPTDVSLKLEITKLFSDYMDKYLMKGGDIENSVKEKQSISIITLNKWIRNNHVLLMELSDGTTQINFLNDHSKLIFSPKNTGRNQLISYIDKNRCAVTMEGDHLNCFKYMSDDWQDFYERLSQAKILLNHLFFYNDINGFRSDLPVKTKDINNYFNQRIIQGIVKI